MRKIPIKDILLYGFYFAVSGVLLTVIGASFGFGFLAWVALVPFIFICSPEAKVWPLVIGAYLVSAIYWLGNLYWLYPVTCLGWIAFCMYTGLLWPLLAIGIQWCRRKNVPLFIGAAVLFVGAERLQGFFLGGFLWRLLAHSQYDNITLIQIADIFGAAGVSFLIGIVNGFVAELIIKLSSKKQIFTLGLSMQIVLVSATVAGTILYGRWRLSEEEKAVETGPLLAAVQSNVPQSVKDSGVAESDEKMFTDLLENSKTAGETGAKLIVWPETMVSGVLDRRILPLLEESSPSRSFDKRLGEFSKTEGFLLVGATGGEAAIREDQTAYYVSRYNSAFLYKPDGRQAKEQYNKIHLVPFGETIPFKDSIPWLHNFLIKFSPYDFDYTLDAGSEYTVFEITGNNDAEGRQRVYRFGVMICYEDVVPGIARNFAKTGEKSKQIDWLVNISNDGWFVKFKKGKVCPSTELAEHTAICVFRAVENRLAVLRSVNTGISCMIDTLGRVRDGFFAGTLPEKSMVRQGMAGWFADNVPIDKRITFFSKYGQWLDFCCAGCFSLLIMAQGAGRFVRNKRYGRALK